MISKKKAPVDKPLEFPCLMVGDITGVVILATGVEGSCYIGTVVHRGTHASALGRYANNWGADVFKPYKGTIELSN